MSEIGGGDAEPREIDLWKDKTPRRVVVAEDLTAVEPMGGAFQKERLRVKTDLEKNNSMSVVLKLVYDSDEYLSKWSYLRKVGIPTANSMRKVDDKVVAIGDMTANGGEFFGKEKRLQVLNNKGETKRALTETEEVYLRIDPKKIKQEIVDLIELAWQKGVVLPGDDPYDLLVEKDGSWKVVVLDLTQLRKRGANESDMVCKNMIKEQKKRVDEMRKCLLEIKNHDR